MSHKPRLVLQIVRTDRTFAEESVRGERAWVGKCIHCNARLVVGLDGKAYGATIEHIVPRSHGGADDPHNLALACPRCNAGKGVSVDARHRTDPKYVEVVTRLLAVRASRWRDDGEAQAAPPETSEETRRGARSTRAPHAENRDVERDTSRRAKRRR